MQCLVFYEDIIVLALNRIISFSFEASTKSVRPLTVNLMSLNKFLTFLKEFSIIEFMIIYNITLLLKIEL